MTRPAVRFLHGADFHIARRPEDISSPATASLAARFTALDRFIEAARRHAVDFVVVAGDLFDAPEARRGETVDRVLTAFNRLAPPDGRAIPAIIIHGNHDFGVERDWGVRLPNHLTILPQAAPRTVEVRRDDVVVARVTGQSFASRVERRPMHRDYNALDRNVFNIALLHTDLGGSESSDVPCTPADLTGRADFDYWALGHFHAPRILTPEAAPVTVAYSGMLQGGDIGEPGPHGALLVELKDGAKPEIRLVPTESICWLERTVAVDPLSGTEASLDDVVALILEDAKRLVASGVAMPMPPLGSSPIEKYVIRWILSGRAEVHRTALAKYLEEETDFPRRRVNEEIGRSAASSPSVSACEVAIRTALPRPSLDELARSSSGLVYQALLAAAAGIEKEIGAAADDAAIRARFGAQAALEPDLESLDGDWENERAFKTVSFMRREIPGLVREALEAVVDDLYAIQEREREA